VASLPYVTAPGNVERALNAIKAAATPEAVSQDFVKTILGIPGGSGNQITAYLKKIGFANADGKPSDLYKKFRNPATEGWAAAQALKVGYAPLYSRNEYMHQVTDAQLRGLIVEETGVGQESAVVATVLGCIKQLKKFARWDPLSVEEKTDKALIEALPQNSNKQNLPVSTQPFGMNLGYTINLNLPATSDPSVFNAIFRALKEHLLKVSNE